MRGRIGQSGIEDRRCTRACPARYSAMRWRRCGRRGRRGFRGSGVRAAAGRRLPDRSSQRESIILFAAFVGTRARGDDGTGSDVTMSAEVLGGQVHHGVSPQQPAAFAGWGWRRCYRPPRRRRDGGRFPPVQRCRHSAEWGWWGFRGEKRVFRLARPGDAKNERSPSNEKKWGADPASRQEFERRAWLCHRR